MLKRRQKGVLNEVLCVLAMMKEPHRQRHRPRQVPLDDLTECLTLAISDASEKLAFCIRIVAGAKHQRST